LLAFACWHALFTAFVGGSSNTSGSRMPARVNIFDFGFEAVGGQELNKKEVGTKSQREADMATSRLVECSKPLGVQFEEKDGGDIYIKAVDPASDAYDQGVRAGAQLVMVSATFGDEMWNTKQVGMTQLMTVLNSRFGNTITLALEKENKAAAGGFFDQFAPKEPQTEADKQAEKNKKAKMASTFEEEEAKLADKNFWNPFR